MFGEKFFYLNKSTTKYVITGLEPEFLEPVVKICDRVSGSYISIKKDNWGEFIRIVAAIIDSSYRLENGFIDGSVQLCGVKFYCSGGEIWKLTQEHTTLLIHKSSFKSFMRIVKLIILHLSNTDTASYASFIAEIRQNAMEMTDGDILGYLYDRIKVFGPGSVEYQVLFDLICNRDSYMGLKKFDAEFYNRNKYL